jgi:hypothetical protein
MKDALLAAVVAKLPEPCMPFSASEREAWFDMMRKAVDVAYGPVESNRAALSNMNVVFAENPQKQLLNSIETANKPRRFYIDRDGFAMRDGVPIDPADVPPGATLWDERTGRDHGDVDAIMWKTGGSNKQPLPAGIQTRAAEARAMNGEATS